MLGLGRKKKITQEQVLARCSEILKSMAEFKDSTQRKLDQLIEMDPRLAEYINAVHGGDEDMSDDLLSTALAGNSISYYTFMTFLASTNVHEKIVDELEFFTESVNANLKDEQE